MTGCWDAFSTDTMAGLYQGQAGSYRTGPDATAGYVMLGQRKREATHLRGLSCSSESDPQMREATPVHGPTDTWART